MFLAGTAMSWLAEPQVLCRELYALAREVVGWDDRESQRRLHAIFKRAHMAAKGERVEWDGVTVDPRYRFTNDTIIEWLEITTDEERQMLTPSPPMSAAGEIENVSSRNGGELGR